MITYSLNEYGLREKDMDFMMNLFVQYPEIEKVVLYGSRASGNYDLGSDVDLAIKGKNVKLHEIVRIHDILEEESPIPLWFDVLLYERLKNEKLKKEIDSFGKVIYTKLPE